MLIPSILLSALGEHLEFIELVQPLWSDYGHIVRLRNSTDGQSYIVKVISPQKVGVHPRGWGTPASHIRKLQSYQVEIKFYQQYSALTDEPCRVPRLIYAHNSDEQQLLVLEDLNTSGFSQRLETATWSQLKVIIRWLAFFHAKFMGVEAQELWTCGTYWHFLTRQDEWHTMPNTELKHQAQAIDEALAQAQFQTLVHGDAKLANFCFSLDKAHAAAVDFQYVGQGTGVKDLAYLAGSAFTSQQLEAYHTQILDEYIAQVKAALKYYGKQIETDKWERETKQLYPLAWADFYRFLLGWNPKSWKICDYMKTMAQKGVSNLRVSK